MPNRGRGRLNRMGGADALPVLGWKILERHQFLVIPAQFQWRQIAPIWFCEWQIRATKASQPAKITEMLTRNFLISDSRLSFRKKRQRQKEYNPSYSSIWNLPVLLSKRICQSEVITEVDGSGSLGLPADSDSINIRKIRRIKSLMSSVCLIRFRLAL